MTTHPPIVTSDPRHATATPPRAVPAHEVAPDVLLHRAFVNTYALRTGVGLLLIDPGLLQNAQVVHRAVRAFSSAPLHTAVYTHGHVDHAFGLGAFLDAGERPHIVAQENCLQRFRRYRLTQGLNTHINRRQFGNPEYVFPDQITWPTLTFRDALSQRLGDLDVHYRAAKGETDDHCYVWIPERSYLFTGDLVIWASPNCGNPQKVQRYPVEWAEALEEMSGLDAEWLFPGHGLIVHGRNAVRDVLSDTARYLRVIIDQVLARLNMGQTPEVIFHAVEPDPELSARPYLRARYDHPKFIVRNLLRQWGGWWNGNAADLLPAPAEAQAREIANLAGGVAAVVGRGRQLLDQGDTVLASHLAEWAARAAPGDSSAQALKRDVYARRLQEAEAFMAQGIYRNAMNEARTALGQEPIMPSSTIAL
ncbi:MAG TPA: alkyl sulfatase dimerization domain-containing protein [Candidatus Methylomirabilis sp.]|nr:alkyl sulfatase dimerization domain-containing protein [Candidatus Methylomirabilis sp.]